MIGDNSRKALLAIINAYYDEENGYAHISLPELNEKYGIAVNTAPKIFEQLHQKGYIEDCTINGYFKRFKILIPYECPKFVIEENGLSISQKNYILKCKEANIDKTMSKKELARRILNSENTSNITRSFEKIFKDSGKTVFEYLQDITNITGLTPKNAELTKYGYRTSIKKSKFRIETKEDKIVSFLYSKSFTGSKQRRIEYNLTPEYIKLLLLHQDFKDYYTGIKPNNYKEYSIDRIDSSKGYIQGNIVITTNNINVMKNNLSIDEFKNQIKLLYNNINNF